MRPWIAMFTCVACTTAAAPAPPRPGTPPAAVVVEPEERRLGPASAAYRTEPQPNGVMGGRAAEALAASIGEALRARGAEAQPDGALAATAAWYLEEAAAGRTLGNSECELAARHFGFAGALLSAVAFGGGERPDPDLWRRSLAQLPGNLPVTRFGVRASPTGYAAVVFGSMEATLAPFPRRRAPGQTVHLAGEVARRFAEARVYLAAPDGKVQETAPRARTIDATLALPSAGVYRVEVMGDGASGPVVVVNVPLYVGVDEPALGQAGAPRASAAAVDEVEARLLVLLNQARAQAALAPLAPDAELRAVALAHDEDMARNHFFGHVSPTTGTPEQRMRRAGVLLSLSGENIAQAATAEAAHQGLMDSPAHRANMLGPKFTHVGIAVVNDGDQLLATLMFGRRSGGGAEGGKRVLEAIAALRRARGLPPAVDDPVLRAAALTGIKAFGHGGAQAVFDASNAALGEEAARRGVARPGVCARLFEIVDADQVEELPVLVDRRLRRIGVGVTSRAEGKGSLLVLLVLAEGVKCD